MSIARNFLQSRRLVVASIGLVLMVAGLLFAFRGVGAWLVCEDPLKPADAILVLSGSMPYRAEEAAKVYRGGYAREVWVSRPQGPPQLLAQLGIPYVSEEEYNREVLIHEGVPLARIHLFPDPIADTKDELDEMARVMRLGGIETVIIVTSPQHTRRVRAIWRHMPKPHGRAIIRVAWEDSFDAQHWWRHTSDTYSVVRELMGLLNVWLGFPVHPRSA